MSVPTIFRFCLFCLCTFQVTGQTTFIKEVGQKNGLPTRSIYDLFVDKEGFLYLGTEIGMFRFNGMEFQRKAFLNNKGNSVNDIQQDKDGIIWCMNFSNQIFFLQNDTLVAHDAINAKIETSGPLRSFAVVDNDIWVVTDRQVFVLSNGRIIPVLNKPPGNREILFNEIVVHPETKRIYVVDPEKFLEIDRFRLLKKHNFQYKSQKEIVFVDDRMLILNKRNAQQNEVYNQVPSSISQSILPPTYLNKPVHIDNSLWLCTNDGLYELNTALNKQISVNLRGVRISDIVKDPEGGLWVSSVEKGLFYIPDKRIKSVKISAYNHNVLALGPKNTLFVGTGDGKIIQVSKSGQILKEIFTDLATEIEFIYYDFTKNRIICSHGVYDLSQKNNNISLYLGKAVTPDDKNNLLFASYNRAFFTHSDFNKLPNSFVTPEANDLKLQDRVPFAEIRSNRSKSTIFDFKTKCYYVGYADKLIRYDQFGTQKEIKSLAGKDIIANHLLLRDNGDLIIGSIQDGVHIVRNGKAIDHYSTTQGLSSNTIRKILLIEENLFTLTDIGLDVIHLNKQTIRLFPLFQFFHGMSFSDMVITNGLLWLSGGEEIIVIPTDLNSRITFPKIHSIKTLVSGKFVDLNQTQISHFQNDLRISIDASHFQSSGQFDFGYRLKGYDADWNYQPAINNAINYLSLPPGKYSFELKTVLNGMHSPSTAIHFEIAPPFWTTWWFRIMILLAVTALLYLLFKQNLQRLRKKQLIKERLLISQMIALRAQMNPHFMFNVLNSVQGLIYMNKKNEASLYLGKFSTMMRRMLEFSDKPQLTLEKEIELINLYLELEAARFDGELKYTIHNQLSHHQLEHEIPSMIIQPYVENAIKHGLLHKKGSKKLDIYFDWTSTGLKVRIVDNGVGREISRQINAKRTHHKSFATEAIDSRISLMNRIRKHPIEIEIRDLQDDHGQSIGTEVLIQIPNEDDK